MQAEPNMNLQGTNVKQFPPITKPRALEIAAQVCNDQSGEFVCHSQKPESYHFYITYPNQPCWYVSAPWADGRLALRSSRVMVISRLTGKILYDGSAGDEG
jgi:hypothetical protein